MVDEEHPEKWPQGKRQVVRQIKVADELAPVGFGSYVSYQCERGRREKGKPYPVKNPYDQKRPKGRRQGGHLEGRRGRRQPRPEPHRPGRGRLGGGGARARPRTRGEADLLLAGLRQGVGGLVGRREGGQ